MAGAEKKTAAPQHPETKTEEPGVAGAEEQPAGPEPSQEEPVRAMKASLPTAPIVTPEIPKPPIRRRDEDAASIIVRTMEALRGQKKVKIIIPSTELEKDPVVVGLNGYVYRIKRDEPVEVPSSVLGVLMEAKITSYLQRKREDGEGNELVPVVSLRFPVSRV